MKKLIKIKAQISSGVSLGSLHGAFSRLKKTIIYLNYFFKFRLDLRGRMIDLHYRINLGRKIMSNQTSKTVNYMGDST